MATYKIKRKTWAADKSDTRTQKTPEEVIEDVCDSERLHLLKNSLYSAWKTREYCDVIIRIGELTTHAHKLVLFSLSDYFKAACKLDPTTNKKEICLPSDIDFNCLNQIIEYGYTGQISINGGNVQNLMIASDFLQVVFVKSSCEKFMIENFDLSTCSGCYELSERFMLPKLKMSVLSLTTHMFGKLLKFDDAFKFPLNMVLSIVRSADLLILDRFVPVPPEIVEKLTLRWILRYIQRNNLRNLDILQLLISVRMPYIPVEVIHAEMKHYPKVFDIEDVKQLVRAAEYTQMTSKVDRLPHQTWQYPRFPRTQTINRNQTRFGDYGLSNIYLPRNDDTKKIDPRTRIRGIEVYCTKEEFGDKDDIKVSGLAVKYSNGVVVKHGMSKNSPKCIASHRFMLAETEAITKIYIHSGICIDSLTFLTNHGNEFGPYGGCRGRFAYALVPKYSLGYLFAFSSEANLNDDRTLYSLSFSWMCFYRNDKDLKDETHSEVEERCDPYIIINTDLCVEKYEYRNDQYSKVCAPKPVCTYASVAVVGVEPKGPSSLNNTKWKCSMPSYASALKI